jgi:hypothetical protein
MAGMSLEERAASFNSQFEGIKLSHD